MVRSFGCTLPGEVAAMNGPAPDTPSQSYPTNYRYLRGSWHRHPRRRGLRAFGFESDRWSYYQVLAEQTAAIDRSRLGQSLGHLSLDEMRRVDAALRIVLDV